MRMFPANGRPGRPPFPMDILKETERQSLPPLSAAGPHPDYEVPIAAGAAHTLPQNVASSYFLGF